MINITEQGGNAVYGLVSLVLDTDSDIDTLPKNVAPGSSAYVIENGRVFMLNGEKEWVEQ